MSNTQYPGSLLEQTEGKKKKWGGDIFNYDIKGAINNYDSQLAKYNDVATSQEEKDAINAIYGGDITKWDNKNAYTTYMDDLNYVNYIDSLNRGYESTMNEAKQAAQEKAQYVDTRRTLMEKYLPDTLQAQGLANTGYVADTLLKAENNYNQYLLGAMNEKAQTEQNAMQSYQDALGTYKQQQANTAYERFLQEQAKKETEEKEAKAQAEAKENTNREIKSEIIGSIAEGADPDVVIKQGEVLGLTPEEIEEVKATADEMLLKEQEKLYKEYLSYVDSLTYKEIDDAERGGLISPDHASALRNAIAEGITVTDAVFNQSGSEITGEEGDNFSIVYDGKKYRVESAGEETNSRINTYAANSLKDGQVFAYSGELYIYRNGKVYRIKERPRTLSNLTLGIADDYDELKNALIK